MTRPGDLIVVSRILILVEISEGGQGSRPYVTYFEKGDEVDAEIDTSGQAHIWVKGTRDEWLAGDRTTMRVTIQKGEFRIISPLELLARCAE